MLHSCLTLLAPYEKGKLQKHKNAQFLRETLEMLVKTCPWDPWHPQEVSSVSRKN